MSLQGTLSTLGIIELLELLAKRDASGQLDVTTTNGSASYLFADGKISLAEFTFARGTGEDSAEATYYVLAEEDGTFYYDPQVVEGVPEGEAVKTMLGRASEVGDRWAEVEASIPSVSHIVCRNSQLDSSVTIEPEWWSVLEVLGTGKTSTQVAQVLELSVLDASTSLREMVDAGLLVATDDVIEEAAPEALVPEPAPAPEMAEAAVQEAATEPAPIQEAPTEQAPVQEVSFSNDEAPAQTMSFSNDEAPAQTMSFANEEAPVQEMSFSNDEGELIEDSIVPISPDLGEEGEESVLEAVQALDVPVAEVPQPVAEVPQPVAEVPQPVVEAVPDVPAALSLIHI